MPKEKWNPEKYPPALLEAAALQSLLNAIGYDLQTEIFLGIGDECLYVTLRIADHGDVHFPVGTFEQSPQEIYELAVEAFRDWNTLTTNSERESIVNASRARHNMPKIIFALMLLGLCGPRSKPTLH
ncbi:MAG: hypothetical protein Q7S04_02555 [Candidatus Moranbacteria bacterium]|nr:hypothetical protein [Candidatus Moranbacteria bacterium]